MTTAAPPVYRTERRAAEHGRRLISTADAARMVDVHPRTLRNYIAQGYLTGYRVGPRLLKVDADELERFLSPIPTSGGGR